LDPAIINVSRPRTGDDPMARKPRIFVPHGNFHVYCRVSRGEPVFEDRCEAEHWVTTLRETVRLHRLKVLAWCLMSNHYHLVLRSGREPLWRAMARIQRRTSWHFNRCAGVKGRLWQSRYQAKLILDQAYFDQAVAYVHLNPVAAGIVSDPADYRWCGHNELIGRSAPSLIDVAEALVCYGDNLPESRRAYLEQVKFVQEARSHTESVRELPWWKPIADNEQTVETPDAPAEAVWFDEHPVDFRDPRCLPLEIVADWFEQVLPEAERRLRSRTQSPQHGRL